MTEKTTILVVEDEPIQLQVLLHNFSKIPDCVVLSATNTEDAIAIAIEQRPSLIVSDYYMPGLNGLELCRAIKAHPDLRGTIFVVLTSVSDTTSKVKGLNVGADDYIAKPVHFAELLSKVRALLRIKALQHELADDKRELEKLNHELQEDFDGMISLLMKVLALRVPDAVARAEQASRMCEWILDRLGADNSEKRTILLAARLREIGKISLPDGLLRTPPAQYSQKDRDQFEEYPVLGQLIVGDIPQLKDIGILLRHQNENYDGSGYPDRLTGPQIPLGSRILRSINATQALMEAGGNSVSACSEKLMDLVGTLLDPRIGLLAEEFTRVVADPSWMEGKQCVQLDDLREGMVIAGDLLTGRGMLLLSKDSRLTQSQIQHLLSLSHFDPIIHGIYVYNSSTQANALK
jgi:response regulator RpfG family c-di-GMP phosphodiesterase